MPDFRTSWRVVSAMFILNGALFGIWASRIPAVAIRFDLSPGDLGGLLLLMAVGAILSFPLSGRYSDKIGAARITWRFAFAYVGALFLIALAPSYGTLALALFLFGATHGGMDVAMNTWAAEAERHIGRPVMSSFHAMFSLGAGQVLMSVLNLMDLLLGEPLPLYLLVVRDSQTEKPEIKEDIICL